MDIRKFYRSSFSSLSIEHRQIASGAVWAAAYLLFSKIIAAFKEVVVASRYGVSNVVDAYQLANTFMLWIPGTLGSALTVVLIPALISLKENPNERQLFISELKGALIILGAIMSSLAMLFLPVSLPRITSNLSPAVENYTWVFCMGLIIPSILCLQYFFHSSRLMSCRSQVGSLLEGIPSALILIFVLIWPVDAKTEPLLWGTLSGYVIQTIVFSKMANKVSGDVPRYKFSYKSPQWATTGGMVGMMILGQFMLSWITPIDIAAAASLGDGAVSTMGYAERALSLLLTLGAMATSRAILPVFSVIAAAKNYPRLKSVALSWGVILGGIGMVVAALGWVLAPWGIGVLYERGAFDFNDTKVVAEVFRWGLIRVPFYFAGMVFFQLLASQRLFGLVVLINLSCLPIKYLMNKVFMQNMSVAGINLATGIMYAWTMCAFLVAGLWALRSKTS